MGLADIVFIAASIILSFGIAIVCAGWFGRLLQIKLPDGPSRIGHIDGLRGFLAFSVFCHHFAITKSLDSAGQGWAEPASNVLNNLGGGAVVVFFMITGAVFHQRFTDDPRKTDWRRHYISRVFRLTPAMWFGTLCVGLIALAQNPTLLGLNWSHEILAFLQWLFFAGFPNLLGQQSSDLVLAGAAYTLTSEWAYYFALPILAVVFAGLGKWLKPQTALFLILALVALPFLVPGYQPYGMVMYAPLFALGVIAASPLVTRPKMEGNAWSVIALLGVALALTINHNAYNLVSYALLYLMLLAVANGNSLFGLLQVYGVRVLGEISYSIYLLHGLVLYLLARPLLNAQIFDHAAVWGWCFAALLTPILIGAAALVHVLVEVPGIAWGKAINQWFKAKSAPKPVAAV